MPSLAEMAKPKSSFPFRRIGGGAGASQERAFATQKTMCAQPSTTHGSLGGEGSLCFLNRNQENPDRPGGQGRGRVGAATAERDPALLGLEADRSIP